MSRGMLRWHIVVVLLALTVVCAAALPKGATFMADGPDYIAEAVGTGDSEAAAQNDALRAAIGVVMDALGKDALFTELFFKNPPVTMSWKKLSSSQGIGSWTVRVKLVVDDESLRLLYNSSYVSTVSTLLDEAETRLADAERLASQARDAETEGQLGRAMSLYWQARDASDSGLDLLGPVGDAAVFSTFGKKKAPELREVLGAVKATSVAGYDRIRTAERGLAEDEELSSALATLAELDTDVSEAETWAAGIGGRAASIEGAPKAELRAFSDELEARRRILSDARLALGRVEETIPKTKEIVRARVDVIRRRIDGTTAYIKKTKAAVDREIRDPAIARAKRARTIRWALLHEPSGALALRMYSPFGLDPTSNDIAFMDTGRFEFALRAEGSLGKEKGLWIATVVEKDDAVLSETTFTGDDVKNTGYAQSVDLGLYGRSLFGVGMTWDWLRRVSGQSVDKRLALRAFLGGLDDDGGTAAWLAALSWELPYDMNEFAMVNYLNIGLDAFARFGTAAEVNASLALRPREGVDSYDTSLRYSVGAGFRLPKPFLWGAEYAGHAARPIDASDGDRSASYVRLFLEYSL